MFVSPCLIGLHKIKLNPAATLSTQILSVLALSAVSSDDQMVDGREFIYLVSYQHLWRFDVRNLNQPPQLIKDLYGNTFPNGMGGMIVNSKLYLLGGQKFHVGSRQFDFLSFIKDEDEYEGEDDDGYEDEDEDEHKKKWCYNHDVYEVDPTNLKDPVFPVVNNSIPKMNGPKIRPIVATIRDRVYVLSTFYGYESHVVFEAFDCSKQLWIPLAPPPTKLQPGYYFCDRHGVWDDKLFVTISYGVEAYFDVEDDKWYPAEPFYRGRNIDPQLDPIPCGEMVQFGNFLICLDFRQSRFSLTFYVCRFDCNGIFKSYTTLNFGSFLDGFEGDLWCCSCYMNLLGNDGRLSVLMSTDGEEDTNWFVRVGIFRVQVSTSDDEEALSLLLIESHSFNLGEMRWSSMLVFESVLVLCEESKKRAIENAEADGSVKKEEYYLLE